MGSGYNKVGWVNDSPPGINAQNLGKMDTAIQNITNGSSLYYVTTNVGNAYSITSIGNAYITYVVGMTIRVKFNASNTGASTINLDGNGAIGIKKNVSVDLTLNDIVQNKIYELIFDGSSFQLNGSSGELTSNLTSKGSMIYASDDYTPNELPIDLNSKFLTASNGLPSWGYGNIGRINADYGFGNTVFTNCGLNSNGEVTLDDYKYIDSLTTGNTNNNTSIYQQFGVGQRFDSTYTANITNISSIYVYIYKYDNRTGTMQDLDVSVYDVTSGTILTSLVIAKNLIPNNTLQWYKIDTNVPITKGHIIDIRMNQHSWGGHVTTGFYQVYYASTDVTSDTHKISSISNNWNTPILDTTQDTLMQVTCNFNPLQTTGTIVKTITPNKVDSWCNLKWYQTIPINTTVVCDVLDSSNNVLKSNVTSIVDLADINVSTYPTIKVKYTLTRTNTGTTTPKVYNCSTTWEGVLKITVNSQSYTTDGQFSFIPAKTGLFKITSIGGGGGGGYYNNGKMGQGGGGGMSIGYVNLTAGVLYTGIVGTGGVGGYANNVSVYGATGSSSSFYGITGTGGSGGTGDTYYGYGGSGGSGSGGIYNMNGDYGAGNVYNGDNSNNGISPYGYGSIGKGGYGNNVGQSGMVIIEWEETK